MKKMILCLFLILSFGLIYFSFLMKKSDYTQCFSSWMKLISETSIPQKGMTLGKYFIEGTELLQFEYAYLTITVENEKRIEEILGRLQHKILYSEVFPVITVSEFPVKMTLNSKEEEISFIEKNETLEVGGASFTSLYGYLSDAEASYKSGSSSYSCSYLHRELKELCKPYLIKINQVDFLPILSIQSKGIMIEGDEKEIIENSEKGNLYYMHLYDSIQDFDFKKEGLKAFENGIEIEVFSDTPGVHCIYFQRENERYLLTYFCE